MKRLHGLQSERLLVMRRSWWWTERRRERETQALDSRLTQGLMKNIFPYPFDWRRTSRFVKASNPRSIMRDSIPQFSIQSLSFFSSALSNIYFLFHNFFPTLFLYILSESSLLYSDRLYVEKLENALLGAWDHYIKGNPPAHLGPFDANVRESRCDGNLT